MATNFLEATGTNGFISGPTACTITLNGLGIGLAVTSTTIFGPGNTSLGQAQKLHAYFTVVTAGFTTLAGATLAGWCLLSTDGGTTFEAQPVTGSSTVPAVGRTPDFVIPLQVGAITTGVYFAQGPFRNPYLPFKVVIQNYTGVALSANAHTLNLGGVADQY